MLRIDNAYYFSSGAVVDLDDIKRAVEQSIAKSLGYFGGPPTTLWDWCWGTFDRTTNLCESME